MTSPWEAPLLPDQGDDNENDTYLAVGKIISGWETIEFELSRLYSVFERDPDGLCMRNPRQGGHPVDRVMRGALSAI